MNSVIHGDCLDVLRTLPDNSIDSVVTDPPYGIAFMGREWDSFKDTQEYAAWCEQWARECLRVLKPGGHLLAFSGTRTYHALAWGVESAGFEIRDMIEWVYTQGFPKSMDISKQFDKMAGAKREVVGEKLTGKARVRLERRNADEGFESGNMVVPITAPATPLAKQWDGWHTALKPAHEPIVMARKPLEGTVCANVEKWSTGALNVDGCRIPTDENTSRPNGRTAIWNKEGTMKTDIGGGHELGRFPANCVTLDDDAWYSKYFNITPREVSKKASKRDRNSNWRGEVVCDNRHCTVKPVPLMQWLIRLVTPPGGIVLDPFAGSGSTLVAAKREGFWFIGIERELEYVEIARRRLAERQTLTPALV